VFYRCLRSHLINAVKFDVILIVVSIRNQYLSVNEFKLTQDASWLIILLNGCWPMPARKVTSNSADRLTVTLDAADRAELDRLAAETDRSLAWIVREALRQYLEKVRDSQREKSD